MNIVNKHGDSTNFDLIAPYYNRLQKLVFGQQLRIAQSHFFSLIETNSKVLVIGGGTGDFLPSLLSKKPKQITYIESSLVMLNLAKKNHDNDCIDWMPKNVLDWKSETEYDVILLPFVLDLFTENSVDEILRHLIDFLNPKGCFILTDFYYSEKKLSNFLIAFMIRFFGLVSNIKSRRLPDYENSFSKIGFTKKKSEEYLNKMVRTEMFIKSELY